MTRVVHCAVRNGHIAISGWLLQRRRPGITKLPSIYANPCGAPHETLNQLQLRGVEMGRPAPKRDSLSCVLSNDNVDANAALDSTSLRMIIGRAVDSR